MLGRRSVRSPRTLAVPAMPFAAAAVALLVLTGCGGEPVDAATPAPEGPAGFGRDRAALVLTAFDQADSAASVAGDVETLRTQEVSPSLDLSIAAAVGPLQPADATVVPAHQPRLRGAARRPGLLPPTATLKLAGSELAHRRQPVRARC